jgi:hypothetical protein
VAGTVTKSAKDGFGFCRCLFTRRGRKDDSLEKG